MYLYFYRYSLVDDLVFFLALMTLVFFSVYAAFGSRFLIQDNQIKYLKFFIWKRAFTVGNISNMSVKDVSNAYGSVPCLYIYYLQNNKIKYIFLPTMHYSKNDLADIALKLIKLKPSIDVDQSAIDYLQLDV